MEIQISLTWSEGDLVLSVSEDRGLVRVEVDPRLSEAQVMAACSRLELIGEDVLSAWRVRLGVSDEPALAT